MIRIEVHGGANVREWAAGFLRLELLDLGCKPDVISDPVDLVFMRGNQALSVKVRGGTAEQETTMRALIHSALTCVDYESELFSADAEQVVGLSEGGLAVLDKRLQDLAGEPITLVEVGE